MNKRKIIFDILIIIAFAVFLAAVYSSTPQPDNIVRIGNIEFNTTADSNLTQFQLYNHTDYDDGSYYEQYVDQNFTGYNVFIFNLSTVDYWDDFSNYVRKGFDDTPYETINGIVVYNVSAGQGKHVGEQRFESYIADPHFKTVVKFSTPSQKETLKIASSLKFN